MAWPKNGTVAVTNGSTAVVGAGTTFIGGRVQAGDAISINKTSFAEIASVSADGALTLAEPWLGATGAGLSYSIMRTNDRIGELAQAVSQQTEDVEVMLDGPGAGKFADGSAAAPGVRFLNDQDTGFRRSDANTLVAVTGGADRLTIDGSGLSTFSTGLASDTVAQLAKFYANVGGSVETRLSFGSAAQPSSGAIGVRTLTGAQSEMVLQANAPAGGSTTFRLYTSAGGVATCRQQFGSAGNPNAAAISSVTHSATTGVMLFETSGAERARVDAGGNLLVGAGAGTSHVIQKSTAQNGTPIIDFRQAGEIVVAAIYAIDFSGVNAANPANAAMKLGRSATGRSLACSGTVSANGADYAEYMTKGAGCGTIAAGDVCGVDRDGHLTRTWSEALSFIVKSTDPALVGGDSWAGDIGPRPQEPAPLRPEPQLVLPDEPSPFFVEAHQDWVAECLRVRSDYAVDHAAWVAEDAAHDAATASYEAELPIWEAALEAARQQVDRIAFCGQVPVNVETATLADCEAALADGEPAYLVAVANGGGIGVQLVRESDMTLPLYMRRVGKLWAIRDDRPWIDVQHG